jgi:hypothetical protein
MPSAFFDEFVKIASPVDTYAIARGIVRRIREAAAPRLEDSKTAASKDRLTIPKTRSGRRSMSVATLLAKHNDGTLFRDHEKLGGYPSTPYRRGSFVMTDISGTHGDPSRFPVGTRLDTRPQRGTVWGDVNKDDMLGMADSVVSKETGWEPGGREQLEAFINEAKKPWYKRASADPILAGLHHMAYGQGLLHGGLAERANKQPSDFNPKELKEGTQEEKQEHTDNEAIARQIAMDHLTEHPQYYEALDKMEHKLDEQEKKAWAKLADSWKPQWLEMSFSPDSGYGTQNAVVRAKTRPGDAPAVDEGLTEGQKPKVPASYAMPENTTAPKLAWSLSGPPISEQEALQRKEQAAIAAKKDNAAYLTAGGLGLAGAGALAAKEYTPQALLGYQTLFHGAPSQEVVKGIREHGLLTPNELLRRGAIDPAQIHEKASLEHVYATPRRMIADFFAKQPRNPGDVGGVVTGNIPWDRFKREWENDPNGIGLDNIKPGDAVRSVTGLSPEDLKRTGVDFLKERVKHPAEWGKYIKENPGRVAAGAAITTAIPVGGYLAYRGIKNYVNAGKKPEVLPAEEKTAAAWRKLAKPAIMGQMVKSPTDTCPDTSTLGPPGRIQHQVDHNLFFGPSSDVAPLTGTSSDAYQRV